MSKTSITKEFLAKTALEMLSNDSVNNISVRKIAEKCGVSTRTFYNYFHDKYDLFLYVYTNKLEEFFNSNKDSLSFTPFIKYTGDVLIKFQTYFINYQKYYGQNQFHEDVFQPLFDFYARIITEVYNDEFTDEIKSTLTCFVLGMIGYVDLMFRNNYLPPVEESVAVFTKSIPENLKKYL